MAESDFSWFKILSIFGAGLLALACFVIIAGGIMLITSGNAFNGVFVILAGIACGAGAYFVYRNYQKKTQASKPGVKIEDIKKKNK